MMFSAGSGDSSCPICGHISNALEKSRYGNIFIQFLPVKTGSSSADDACFAFLRCGMEESGKIGQGNSQDPTIGKGDPHGIVVTCYRPGEGLNS
jgi:hypothetical protein